MLVLDVKLDFISVRPLNVCFLLVISPPHLIQECQQALPLCSAVCERQN